MVDSYSYLCGQLLIEQRNYSHLTTYVFKAEAALDATAAAASNAAANSTGGGSAVSATSAKKKSSERDGVQAKLDLATALSHLGQNNYEKAANAFLKIGSTKELGDWAGKVYRLDALFSYNTLIPMQLIAPGDIAIYGTLCALASLKRSQIKSRILENSVFGVYIEQEPYVRELIEAYMSSNFKTVLELLAKYSVCCCLHFPNVVT